MSPPLAAASGGCSRATGYRLWRRYRAGRLGGAARSPLDAAAAAAAAVSRRPSRRSSPPAGARPTDRCGWRGWCRIRPRRSARCCAGTAARGCRGRQPPPPAARAATSASGRASSCTSTPRSSAASGSRASACSASEAGRPQRNRRIGWQHLHVAIDDHSRLAYAELLPGQDADSCVRFLERATRLVPRAGHRRRARADRQRQGLPLARLDRGDPPARASSAATRASTGHAPTARPSASSRRCSASGPTRAATPPARPVPERSPATCAGTTSADPTARSEPGRRSAASHTSVVTTASATGGLAADPVSHVLSTTTPGRPPGVAGAVNLIRTEEASFAYLVSRSTRPTLTR